MHYYICNSSPLRAIHDEHRAFTHRRNSMRIAVIRSSRGYCRYLAARMRVFHRSDDFFCSCNLAHKPWRLTSIIWSRRGQPLTRNSTGHTGDCTGHFCHRNNCDLCGNETDEAPCPFCDLTFCGECQRRGYVYLIHCECTRWC